MTQAFVHSVNIEYSTHGFTRATVELLIPTGFDAQDIRNLDFTKVFSAPKVQEAVKTEIERKLRTISLTD